MDLNVSVVSHGDGRPLAERDSSRRVLTGCFLFLLILTTLLGNTLVCAAVAKFRHLRSKVTNFFVISLAISDLLVAVLVMPWKAATEIVGFWPFGAFCDVWVAFDIMCSTASILNLCVISVDRYWAISSPFRYERKMTPRVAFVMISLAWTLSILISFIPVQLNWHKARTFAELNASYAGGPPPPDNCDSSLNRTYAISSSLISFYIPVAIMIVTYTRIYRIAQKQIRRISALERAAESAKNRHSSMGNNPSMETESSFKMSFKRETKVLKTLSVIMGVFVCCWLPFFILNCMVPFCEQNLAAGRRADFPCISSTTFDVFVWFGWANSSLNPIIYAFNADFRRAFSILLGCHRLCPGGNTVEILSVNNNNGGGGGGGGEGSNPGASGHTPSQYQPRGHIPKEGNPAAAYVIPHSVLCPEDELERKKKDGEEEEEEEVEVITNCVLEKPSPAMSGTLDSYADLSLEKINPFTQNGQHKAVT